MYIKILQFIYISFLSTILHFSYDMTNHLFIFSIIGSVNESTWEHLKIGLFPWFTWFYIRKYYFSIKNSYFANFIAIISFMVTVSSVFYGSNYILQRHCLFMSISSFYIGVLSGMFFEYKIRKKNLNIPLLEKTGFIGCIFICIIGFVWTFYPLRWFLTLDVRYNMLYKNKIHLFLIFRLQFFIIIIFTLFI